MGFGQTWRQRVRERLAHFATSASSQFRQSGSDSLYGFLSAMALWPVAEAARGGSPAALPALGRVVQGAGSRLIASRLGRWKDEAEAAIQLGQAAHNEPALREALDTLLDNLDVVAQIQCSILPPERAWFLGRLHRELVELDSRLTIVRDAGPDTGDSALLRQRYLAALAAEANRFPWTSLIPERTASWEGESLGLADLYVALDTTAPEPVEKDGQVVAFWFQHYPVRGIPVQEVINREARLLLTGEPGTGKSSLVSFVAYILARSGLDEEPRYWLERLTPWCHGPLLPLWVTLRDFAASLPQGTLRGGAALLLQYLCDMLVEWELGSFWPHLRHALSDSKPPLLILLDGLDEVALEMRQVVQESLEDFVARYPQHRYLVTSEPYAHEGRPYRFSGFAQAGLAPLDQRQIDLFISGWYLALARHRQLSPAHAAASARRLRAAVSSSGLRVLAESPLLLTMMTLLHMRRGQFPEDRVELYRWMAGLLVRCWEGRRGSAQALHEALGSPDLKISDLEAGLYEVAFRAYGGHGEMKDSGGVSRRDLQEWLVPYLGGSRHHAARFVDTICERPGLLRHSQPEAFTFAHPTFSPFLAACHLAGRAEFPTESARLVRSDPERWRSVYLLAVSHTAHTGRLKSALCAVDALCPSPFLPGVSAVPADWRAASLAGEALLEIGLDEVQRHRLGRAASQRAQGWLAALLRAGAMSPLERARAGDRLAQIGEARFRADAFALPDEPLLGFVEIPSGPFLMGTREEDVPALLAMHGGRREWYQSETPQHRLTLQAFYIARYPVTVAQFRAFVEDSGYRPWGLNGLRSPDNRPMTWVTWHDALQYCEWLTSRLRKWDGTPEPLGSLLRERGCTVALPTEAQWEKAARGTDGRTFPWGDELDATRCNMTGTGISTTCAVGMFPSGRSLYGVDDVSGNVWEWCRTKWRNSYQEPADDSLQGEAARVLRGGAFALEGWLVRCAARSWYLRGLVSRLVGFRIVVAPDLNPHLGQHPQAQ